MPSLRSLVVPIFFLTLFGAVAFAQSARFTIQLASVASEAEAQARVDELNAKGVEAYWTKAELPDKGTRFRIRTGKFKTSAAAKAAAEAAHARGLIAEFIVTTYDAPAAPVAGKPAPPAQFASKTAPPAQRPAPLPISAATAPPLQPLPVKTAPPRNPMAASSPQIAANKAEATDAAPPVPTVLAHEAPVLEAAPPPKNELIATPGVADALADISISNDRWKVVRRSAETDKNLRAVFFVDALTGWAAGDAGALHKTTDGGRTWKPLLVGASVNIEAIFFVDWNHGWMLGEANTEGGAGEGETVLLATVNGGRTWTRQPLPGVLRLHFIDALNGWAVGRNALLMKTTDGGATWQKLDAMEKLVGLPVESSTYNYGFCDIQFLDAEHGWLIGNFYGRAQSNVGGIFATSDGGATWRRLPITIQTQYASGRFTPGLFHSVKFNDAQTGSVTGEMRDGESRYFFTLHTRDGGRTWEQFRTPSRATHATQFLDLFNGWTAAYAAREGGADAKIYDTTLMRTDNGGMSWRNDFVAKGRRIRGVFFLSPGKGWAVGDRGMILRYEDKAKMN